MNWKDMPLAHKIATIVSCIAAVVWLISEVKSDLFPVDMTTPAIAVFTACEGVIYWKSKRKWAYLFIGAAVISMACFVLELLLK